ncbi:protein KAKU4 isoform X3 [Diospyros lotus]|uniref:protein KAKU4 isoform X3 n=1 Tax=Diospyros lotus TaxID=55363 RepID=UPI0022518B48|nr:protein KAKU4 isoform X3 [Diospyros lotus]
MASLSRRTRRPPADDQSGGKLVRGRRIFASRTPYDRPTAPALSAATTAGTANDWLRGYILPTSRKIASGATRLLSSIFGPDTSSSSSSTSSAAEDSSSEDGDGENDGLNKNGTGSELIGRFRREPQRTVGKSETKRLIEKLLMQETFSREECDRLVKIINSRVIDGSPIEEGQAGRCGEIRSKTVDTPDMCSKAVMEAKQWLEEKKGSSNSKLDLDYGTCALNSVLLSQVANTEPGSPVDVAKSYMQARPPWGSASINYIESRTLSPMEIDLLNRETPYSAAGITVSSSKNTTWMPQKMHSLASGSWNIQEELRRVRSRASEDMLKTAPSTKIVTSSFSLQPKNTRNSLLADEREFDRHELKLLPALELAAGMSTCDGLPASVSEMTQDGSPNDILLSQPVILSTQNQDLETIQMAEGHAASASHQPIIPDFALADSRSSDRTCLTAEEETELRVKPNANGFPSQGSSLLPEDGKENPSPSDDKHIGPSHGNKELADRGLLVEETDELLHEAPNEVPLVNENNSSADGGQNGASMHVEEELSQEQSPVNQKHGFRGRRGKKLTRYNRKPRTKG